MALHQFMLRCPKPLFEQLKRKARRKGMSANALLVEYIQNDGDITSLPDAGPESPALTQPKPISMSAADLSPVLVLEDDPEPEPLAPRKDRAYWAGRIAAWQEMDGAEALDELKAATGGSLPPRELFRPGMAGKLAQWLAENTQ